MDLLIVGTGYVGLVTGACFAEMGHHVTCLDIDLEKIRRLKNGEVPIYEPGLQELVVRNLKQKRLFFTTDYDQALQGAQVAFLAVPTPSREDGSCDIGFVEKAARQIGKALKKGILVVNKSTVPVGTAAKVLSFLQEELSQRGASFPVDVASNPEFLKEGAAVQDCLKPDRILIGADNPKSIASLKEIYAPFTLSHDRVLVMDTLSAEMTKYAANAMLATRISFMNEIAEVCKKVGANVNEVRKGIGSDSRIGYSFLYPGVGYGGSCFPKDVRALIATAKEVGVNPLLLESVDTVNERQKKVLGQTLRDYFSSRGGIQGKTVAIWGLSFKPDTDDMREAPSLSFIGELLKEGAFVRLFDPVAMENARKILPESPAITWCNDEFEAAEKADAVALLTEWKQFRFVDFSVVQKKMKGQAFFDGRNQYKALDMKQKGFDYMGIGVPDQIRK